VTRQLIVHDADSDNNPVATAPGSDLSRDDRRLDELVVKPWLLTANEITHTL
jgi:hypothetical protein